MDVKRALPRPELRSVLRSFGEICVDLGSAARTWPVAARPHQMLQFHLAEPYRTRHDNGPASLMPLTYISGPLTYQRAQIYESGMIHVFNILFHPTGLNRLVGINMSSLVNNAASASDVIGRSALALEDSVRLAPDFPSRVASVERWVSDDDGEARTQRRDRGLIPSVDGRARPCAYRQSRSKIGPEREPVSASLCDQKSEWRQNCLRERSGLTPPWPHITTLRTDHGRILSMILGISIRPILSANAALLLACSQAASSAIGKTLVFPLNDQNIQLLPPTLAHGSPTACSRMEISAGLEVRRLLRPSQSERTTIRSPSDGFADPDETIAAVRRWQEPLFDPPERKATMKSKYKIGAAVIGSFVLGVGASSILHAQAKPPAFVWAEVDIKDRVGYFGNFVAQAQANIKESGGKYLADSFHSDHPNVIGLNGPPPPGCNSPSVRRYGGGQGVLCENGSAPGGCWQ